MSGRSVYVVWRSWGGLPAISGQAMQQGAVSRWTCGGCYRVFNSRFACDMHVTKQAQTSACKSRGVREHQIAGSPHDNQQHVGLPSREVRFQGSGAGVTCTSALILSQSLHMLVLARIHCPPVCSARDHCMEWWVLPCWSCGL